MLGSNDIGGYLSIFDGLCAADIEELSA